MTSVVLNGNAYSDDGSQSRDMRNGGYRNWMLPMLSDAAVEINIAKDAQTYAAQAANSASQAANYASALQATSNTSLTVGAGSQTLTTQTGKQFSAGQYVMLSRVSAPSTYMWGTVTNYSSGSGVLDINVISTGGSGTAADWQISLSGAIGAAGPTNRSYVRTKSSSYTVVLADMGCIIDCTNSFTLSLTAAATLGDGFYVWVRNGGNGSITIDPNASETIDGLSTNNVAAGNFFLLQCDGSSWKTTYSGSITSRKLPILSDTTGFIPASSLETLTDGNNYYNSAMGNVSAVYWASDQSLFVLLCNVAPYVYTSPDGKVWTGRTNTSGGAVGSLAYNGTTWIASNINNTTWSKSTDLITWSACTGPTTGLGVCSAGSNFIAAFTHATGTYYTSPDGVTWTLRYSTGENMTSVVGNSTTRVIASREKAVGFYSTDSGATWNASTTHPTTAIQHIAFGGGRFVGIGYNVSNSSYSTDGITWYAGGTVSNSYNTSIAYGNGAFAIVGNGGYIASGTNGSSWTARASGVTANLTHVIYAGGKFVAVGTSNATIPTVLTSTDGTTWTIRTTGLPTDSSSAYWVYHNGTTFFLNVAGIIYTSTDAVTWSLAGTSNISLQFFTYVGVIGTTLYGISNGLLYSSTNGYTWSPIANNAKLDYLSAYGSELYGVRRGLGRSVDNGTTWTLVNKAIKAQGEYEGWRLSGGTFIAGDSYADWYATSTDGITWTNRILPTPYGYSSASCFIDGKLYLRQVTGGSVISTSDGINWTTETSSWSSGARATGMVFKFRNCWLSGDTTYTHTQGALTDQPATRLPLSGLAARRMIASNATILVSTSPATINVLDLSVDPKGAFI